MRFRLIRVSLALAPFIAQPSLAQPAAPWPSVHQMNAWYGSVYERLITSRFGLFSDLQLRRSSLVEQPKQLFMLGAVSWRATQGMRLALGTGYIASVPYGRLPAANPSREYRLWTQMQLQQKAGPIDFSHRYRYEYRWIHDVLHDSIGNGRHNGDTRFAHRFRYQLRASHPFQSVKLRGQPILGFLADEAFVGLTASDRRVSVDQNRASVGLGLPLGWGERMEVSYMQQWIANVRLKTAEVNRTLVVMFVHNLPSR